MSLENEISQLTKAINELNANFERLFNNQQTTPTSTVRPTQAQEVPTQAQEVPTQAQEVALLPEVAKSDEYTREQLQSLCLEATKRNAANRDIIKAIMLSNFEARKTGDLADNQINLCYSMIAQATKDD